MSSFVTEVLSSAGQLEAKEIQEKMETLGKRMDDLKLEVYEVTKGKYVSFFSQKLQTTASLVDSVEQVSSDIQDATEKIEKEVKNQLNMSTEVITSLQSQLHNHKAVLEILEKLVNIQDGLENASSANKLHQYCRAAQSIIHVESLLSKPLNADEDIKILEALHTECLVQREKLTYEMNDRWKQAVSWTMKEVKESEKTCQLEISTQTEGGALTEVVRAMEILRILDSQMKVFGGRLLNEIIKPLVLTYSTKIINSPENVIAVKSSTSGSHVPPLPKDLFKNIIMILDMLQKFLLKIPLQDGTLIITLLGKHISQEMLELIVKDCLTYAIPHNNKDLASFDASCVIPTSIFQQALVDMGLISKSDNPLSDFVQNINILFANKKSQEILHKAQTLMKSELHNTVQVSDDKPLGDLPSLGKDEPSEKKSRKLELAQGSQLSNETFRFPNCHISVCAQQLMSLAYETLAEATQSSPQCALQMFFAVRNMFELFCCVYPTAHKKSLATFPQLSAIFNNDCMYVAHHLATMGHQFNKVLPPGINYTFVDLMPKIRKLGSETFLRQLTKQRDIMLEYLQGAKGFVSVSEESVFLDAEKALKQIVYQLEHLQKVWQEVLPSSQYKRSIGTLVNSIILEITSCIVSLEDISSDDASQLASLLSFLQLKCGPLQKADSDVNGEMELQRNIPKWIRFKELILLLNASLLEINDRWADGKGPLANEFSSSEVKQMIRALFQNTDRRSTILSKIR